MANEIQVHGPSGMTLKGVLKNAAGQVRDVVAAGWVALDAAVFANCAFALAEQGETGAYFASLPAGADAATDYAVLVFSGAAAASFAEPWAVLTVGPGLGRIAAAATGDIATKAAVFHADYDTAKLAVLVESIEARVSVACNLGGYVEGADAELDAFVVRKVREAIVAELAGGASSRNIEGFSETLAPGGEAAWSTADLAFLGCKTALIRGYA